MKNLFLDSFKKNNDLSGTLAYIHTYIATYILTHVHTYMVESGSSVSPAAGTEHLMKQIVDLK